jgi:hypothetical protein
MLEEVAELGLRFFVRILVEVVFEIVCSYVGLFVLRLCSFGQYPPPVPSERQTTIADLRRLRPGHFWPSPGAQW